MKVCSMVHLQEQAWAALLLKKETVVFFHSRLQNGLVWFRWFHNALGWAEMQIFINLVGMSI